MRAPGWIFSASGPVAAGASAPLWLCRAGSRGRGRRHMHRAQRSFLRRKPRRAAQGRHQSQASHPPLPLPERAAPCGHARIVQRNRESRHAAHQGMKQSLARAAQRWRRPFAPINSRTLPNGTESRLRCRARPASIHPCDTINPERAPIGSPLSVGLHCAIFAAGVFSHSGHGARPSHAPPSSSSRTD